jgi:hypothetical protein
MVQLSATRSSYIAILRVSQVSFATITLSVTSQRVFMVIVWELLDTLSYSHQDFVLKHI